MGGDWYWDLGHLGGGGVVFFFFFYLILFYFIGILGSDFSWKVVFWACEFEFLDF